MTSTLVARLRDAADGLQSDRVTVASLVQAHGPAAQGSLLLMLAVPCLLPIPGTGTVLGFGLLAMAVAMWRGHAETTLPRRVADLEMPGHWGRRVLSTLASIYALAARVARSRSCPLAPAVTGACLAAIVAAMALLLILPIPFGNVLPAASLVLIGVGLAFRDGVMTLLGVLAAALTTVLMSALVVEGGGRLVGWLAERLAGA